jgi:hypothetical protein
LAVTNFSKRKVTISAGQPLAIKHNPNLWLQGRKKLKPLVQEDLIKRANLIQAFAKNLRKEKNESLQFPGDEPLEGGPKTSEPAPTPQKNVSLDEIDISPKLTTSQSKALKEVVKKNESAFGLGMRLGQFPAKVTIRLKPDTEPISLPPFPVSPAKREVMDKQIDEWIKLEVIEPSVSPWGAPAFIVY